MLRRYASLLAVCLGVLCGASPICAADLPQPPNDYGLTVDTLGVPHRMKYGKRNGERLSIYTISRKRGPSPVVIWLPRPGWPYAFPSIDTDQMRMRLVGADFAYAAVETQNPRYYGVKEATREIVTAIAAIVAHATEWNVDTHRLILVGNGSAAYFAVLLATHPGYLIECGIDPSDVKGIVLITPDGLFGPDAVIADSRLSAAEAKGYFGDAGDTGDISPDPDRRSSVVKSYLIFDHPRGHPRDVARFVRAVSHDGVVVNVQPIVATINGISATYLGSRSSTAGDGFVAFARQVTAIPLP